MDWDRLKIFQMVASAGSFTAAGSRLGLSQSAASRQIRSLEKELGVSLFTRHARGIVLTHEGEELFATTEGVMRQLDDTERRLKELHVRPTGALRINTLTTFGAVWLSPQLTPFLSKYPDIELTLILSDEWVDLAAGEADVAIRLGDPGPLDLIQRPLARFHAHVYASSDYLARKGTPVSPKELVNHDLITFDAGEGPLHSPDLIQRLAGVGMKIKPRMRVNNLYGVMHAVEAGVGLAILPDYLVRGSASLIRLFPDMEATSYSSYFCYPKELKGSRRVALLRDFLLDQIRAEARFI